MAEPTKPRRPFPGVAFILPVICSGLREREPDTPINGSVMAARSPHFPANTPAYDDVGADEHYAHEELLAGERVGPPLARARGRAVLWGSVLILIGLGAGWALLDERATSAGWPQALIAAVSSAADRWMPGPVEATAAAVTIGPPANPAPTTKPAAIAAPPSALEPPAPDKSAATPGAAAKSPAPPLATAALPPAAAGSGDLPASPLPPSAADPADPYQVRAAAAGLHPGLSRVLLARLSPADYRNAAFAIDSALAKTADDAVFVWPHQRKPELALFHVRFVPGAGPDCRRYVVTVTKDGWLTTALPMERCGPQLARSRRD
jgi:hypothetical protein